MGVDVRTEIEINRPRDDVGTFASDPDNATTWYENIKAVEWKSPKPLTLGSELTFWAAFLGRRLAYTYKIEEIVPGDENGRRAVPDGDDVRLGRHGKRWDQDVATQPR